MEFSFFTHHPKTEYPPAIAMMKGTWAESGEEGYVIRVLHYNGVYWAVDFRKET